MQPCSCSQLQVWSQSQLRLDSRCLRGRNCDKNVPNASVVLGSMLMEGSFSMRETAYGKERQ